MLFNTSSRKDKTNQFLSSFQNSSVIVNSCTINGECIHMELQESNNNLENTTKSHSSSVEEHYELSKFFPWNDGVDYEALCSSLINQILKFNKSNKVTLIHSGKRGGLGHKTGFLYNSIFLALTKRLPIRCILFHK